MIRISVEKNAQSEISSLLTVLPTRWSPCQIVFSERLTMLLITTTGPKSDVKTWCFQSSWTWSSSVSLQWRCREHLLLHFPGSHSQRARGGRGSHWQPNATWSTADGGRPLGRGQRWETATGGEAAQREEGAREGGCQPALFWPGGRWESQSSSTLPYLVFSSFIPPLASVAWINSVQPLEKVLIKCTTSNLIGKMWFSDYFFCVFEN